MTKASEIFESLLQGSNGDIAIRCTDEEAIDLNVAINQVKLLEKYMLVFKEIVRLENKVQINIKDTPKNIKAMIVNCWETVFKDFED